MNCEWHGSQPQARLSLAASAAELWTLSSEFALWTVCVRAALSQFSRQSISCIVLMRGRFGHERCFAADSDLAITLQHGFQRSALLVALVSATSAVITGCFCIRKVDAVFGVCFAAHGDLAITLQHGCQLRACKWRWSQQQGQLSQAASVSKLLIAVIALLCTADAT